QLAQRGHADILLLGDSILYGWNWPGRPEIWQRHFGRFRTANLAVSGDYIQHLLWRIEHGHLAAFTPATVILLIGANNIDDDTVTAIAKGIMKILNRVKRECFHSRIILTGIFPRGREPDTPVRHKIAAVNTRLALLADGERVVFHNPGPKLLESDGTMTRKMFFDFSHPNVDGYARWAELLSPLLVPPEA
ncbi:MAG: GDSL-type esterase/lipase family protein, partial [Victivallales bacterium]|nr:GDSL-type esterase/lipase family protein [Victivallales bacterium]